MWPCPQGTGAHSHVRSIQRGQWRYTEGGGRTLLCLRERASEEEALVPHPQRWPGDQSVSLGSPSLSSGDLLLCLPRADVL